MPIMDGIKATEAIRNGYSGQMNKNIPIIAITAAAMAGDREKFLSTGMSDYIPKPVDITMLTEAIERVMAGKLVGA